MSNLSDWYNAVSDSVRADRSLAPGERIKYLLPVLLAGALYLFDYFCSGRSFAWPSLASGMVLMVAFMLLLPPDFESVYQSAALIAATVMICASPSAVCLATGGEASLFVAVSCLAAPLMLAVQVIFGLWNRYSGIFSFFRRLAMAPNRKVCLRLCHAALVAFLSCMVLASSNIGGVLEVIGCASASIASLILMLNLEINARLGPAHYSIRTPSDMAPGSLHDSGAAGLPPLANKDRLLYDRVEAFMKEKQPYLEDGFSLTELAVAMCTNKSYLSRTINTYSGFNFCQYVNKYRVEYAIELMRKDKRIKVLELAMTSGFHSVASFNMAFKLHTNDTPSEYMRTLHLCDGY